MTCGHIMHMLHYTVQAVYSTVSITISLSYRFPSASSFTPIWLDELSCSSNDTSLSQCTSRGIGVHDCGHNGDVTLSCLGSKCVDWVHIEVFPCYKQ